MLLTELLKEVREADVSQFPTSALLAALLLVQELVPAMAEWGLPPFAWPSLREAALQAELARRDVDAQQEEGGSADDRVDA